MSQQTDAKRICPYLGLVDDPEARFAYHDSAHRCFAAGQRNPIPLEHQSAFCLTQRYPTCPRFVELPPELEAAATTAAPAAEQEIEWITERPVRGFSFWRTALLGLGGLLVGLVLIIGLFYFSGFTAQGGSAVADAAIPPVLTPTVLPTPIPASPEPMIVDTPTPAAVAFLATPTPTATPRSDVLIYELSPEQSSIGWLTDGEERGNHFGDSYLYAGIFDGQIYNSAFQIDLSSIPRGAPIYSAVLHMTGLRDDRLAVHNDQSDAAGIWTVRLLDSETDQDWRRHNFQDVFNASALHALSPILGAKDLAAGTTNSFALTPAQVKILENRIIDAEEPVVSFRVEGPLVGSNNLFGWDTGYGGQSRGNKVILSFEVGPPPATPPLYDYVIVTSTPTPENVMTAAAILVQETADAERVGTATPVPPNMVTPTPIPDYLVIVPTPTWENTATAQVLVALATAQALTTGTPTPLPTNAVTATSTPTETPTPTPTIPNYVLITSTPTPETVFAAATQAVAATALAQSVGTPTPLPLNWVTPIVVTETPTPVNEATAETIAALATAIAITTGTPTPTPPNMILATSTPVFETIPLILVPTAVPLAPVSPESMPPELLGKVLFLSDREGEEKVYVFDPETGQLGRLTATWPYEMALARDIWSADKLYRVFTKDAIRGESEYSPALYVYDYLYKDEWQLTKLGSGIAYNGVWSPASREIAFVSNDSADDEIWVVNYDGSNARQLTSSNEAYNAREIGKDTFIPELNKFPSWSPDGQEIVFASNRTGNMQLSVMNADGSNQRLLMGWDNWTPYSDWAPVWVKYLDPAPPADKQQ